MSGARNSTSLTSELLSSSEVRRVLAVLTLSMSLITLRKISMGPSLSAGTRSGYGDPAGYISRERPCRLRSRGLRSATSRFCVMFLVPEFDDRQNVRRVAREKFYDEISTAVEPP